MASKSVNLTPISKLFLQVFLPFAVGHFLSNVFRTVNAVISSNLESEFGIGAAELGMLTSAYFFAFALFQLPLGILLDRYGPRRVEAMLLIIAGLGALIFAVGQGLATLTLGRALIGLGVSACLMASFKAFSLWFDPGRLALVNGYLMAFGGLGVVTATVPVDAFVAVTSWRMLFVALAIACFAISALLWFTVPERGQAPISEPLIKQLAALMALFRTPIFIAVIPAAFFSHALGLAIVGLWSGPWFRDVAGLQGGAVAANLMWLAMVTVFGMAAWGVVADRLGRLGITPLQVGGGGTVIFLVASVLMVLQPSDHHLALWMFYAFAATSGSVFYAGLVRRFDGPLAGRVNAVLNVVVFSGAFILQWGFGVVVQFWTAPDGLNGPGGYQVAFAITAVGQSLSLAWFVVMSRRAAT
ncbi:MAG: MFS transporter [Aquisalimonadaceae bacterium]